MNPKLVAANAVADTYFAGTSFQGLKAVAKAIRAGTAGEDAQILANVLMGRAGVFEAGTIRQF